MHKFYQKDVDAFANAAAYGRLDKLREDIAKFGPSIIDHLNTEKRTPLQCAIKRCHFDGVLPAIELLLDYGARVNYRNELGETPLEQVKSEVNDAKRSIEWSRTPDDLHINYAFLGRAEEALKLMTEKTALPADQRLALQLEKDKKAIENAAILKDVAPAPRIILKKSPSP